jgi:hypothetical protein
MYVSYLILTMMDMHSMGGTETVALTLTWQV